MKLQNPKTFYGYFKENMETLGLPAPESLFGTLQTTVATISTIATQVDKFGKAVTIGELIAAGTKIEFLGYIAATSAAFYVGACIGSLAVATGRSLSGGYSLVDLISTAHMHNLNRPWLQPTLRLYPGIYDLRAPSRTNYRYQNRMVYA